MFETYTLEVNALHLPIMFETVLSNNICGVATEPEALLSLSLSLSFSRAATEPEARFSMRRLRTGCPGKLGCAFPSPGQFECVAFFCSCRFRWFFCVVVGDRPEDRQCVFVFDGLAESVTVFGAAKAQCYDSTVRQSRREGVFNGALPHVGQPAGPSRSVPLQSA